MKQWIRMVVSFAALCLVVAGIAYFLGPRSAQQAANDGGPTVGQLPADHNLKSPGQPETTADQSATSSGSSSEAPAEAPAAAPAQ